MSPANSGPLARPTLWQALGAAANSPTASDAPKHEHEGEGEREHDHTAAADPMAVDEVPAASLTGSLFPRAQGSHAPTPPRNGEPEAPARLPSHSGASPIPSNLPADAGPTPGANAVREASAGLVNSDGALKSESLHPSSGPAQESSGEDDNPHLTLFFQQVQDLSSEWDEVLSIHANYAAAAEELRLRYNEALRAMQRVQEQAALAITQAETAFKRAERCRVQQEQLVHTLKQAEEVRAREAAERRRDERERLAHAEQAAEQERALKVEQNAALEEELRRHREEQSQQEEEARRREEARRKEEEELKRAEDAKLKEEEARRQEEARCKEEEERKRAEQAKLREEELRHRAEQEARLREEKLRKEEEERKRAEEARREEAERRKEEELREEARKKAAKHRREVAETRLREEKLRKEEEERKRAEEARLEGLRRREESERLKEEKPREEAREKAAERRRAVADREQEAKVLKQQAADRRQAQPQEHMQSRSDYVRELEKSPHLGSSPASGPPVSAYPPAANATIPSGGRPAFSQRIDRRASVSQLAATPAVSAQVIDRRASMSQLAAAPVVSAQVIDRRASASQLAAAPIVPAGRQHSSALSAPVSSQTKPPPSSNQKCADPPTFKGPPDIVKKEEPEDEGALLRPRPQAITSTSSLSVPSRLDSTREGVSAPTYPKDARGVPAPAQARPSTGLGYIAPPPEHAHRLATATDSSTVNAHPPPIGRSMPQTGIRPTSVQRSEQMPPQNVANPPPSAAIYAGSATSAVARLDARPRAQPPMPPSSAPRPTPSASHGVDRAGHLRAEAAPVPPSDPTPPAPQGHNPASQGAAAHPAIYRNGVAHSSAAVAHPAAFGGGGGRTTSTTNGATGAPRPIAHPPPQRAPAPVAVTRPLPLEISPRREPSPISPAYEGHDNAMGGHPTAARRDSPYDDWHPPSARGRPPPASRPRRSVSPPPRRPAHADARYSPDRPLSVPRKRGPPPPYDRTGPRSAYGGVDRPSSDPAYKRRRSDSYSPAEPAHAGWRVMEEPSDYDRRPANTGYHRDDPPQRSYADRHSYPTRSPSPPSPVRRRPPYQEPPSAVQSEAHAPRQSLASRMSDGDYAMTETQASDASNHNPSSDYFASSVPLGQRLSDGVTPTSPGSYRGARGGVRARGRGTKRGASIQLADRLSK
jgi:hypothetical protein